MESSNAPDAIAFAEHYFAASNRSDFDAIGSLLAPTTTYSSTNSGVYLGADQILEMQRAYHARFTKLEWIIKECVEERPGVVRIAFQFIGTSTIGEEVQTEGMEYIVVYEGTIQHIEVRNV